VNAITRHGVRVTTAVFIALSIVRDGPEVQRERDLEI
jgi:hypothetical protein